MLVFKNQATLVFCTVVGLMLLTRSIALIDCLVKTIEIEIATKVETLK